MPQIDEVEKIANRYILITDLPVGEISAPENSKMCRTYDLGKVCKAFDIEDNGYVTLMLLHEWCTLLPQETIQNLQTAAEKLKPQAEEDGRQPVLQYILDDNLILLGEQTDGLGYPATRNGLTREIIDGERVQYYIVLAWVEPFLSPDQLFQNHFRTIRDAVAFVASLATQLDNLYKETKYIRPVIEIEHLKRRPVSEENVGVMLDDLNLDMVLDGRERSQADEQADAGRAAILLTQLLDGIWRYQQGETLEFATLEKSREEVEKKWRTSPPNDAPPAELWEVLKNAPELTLPELAEQLKNVHIPQQKTIKSESSGASVLAPFPRRTAPQFNRIKAPEEAISYLELRIISGADEFVLEQPLRMSSPTLLGDASLTLTEKTKSDLDIDAEEERDKLAYFRADLAKRRIYIRRHEADRHEGSAAIAYYTVTDIDQPLPNNNTRLNGKPLSPLFSALFTAGATLETDTNFRIKLKTSERGRPRGWVTAQEQHLPALIAPADPLVADSTADSVELLLTINNPTDRVERMAIAVDGVPSDWPAFMPQTVPLFDEESVQRTFSIQLPAARLAGEYKLIVRLISDNIGAQVAAETVRLIVPQRVEFAGALRPESVRAGEYGELYIENLGNFQRDFIISWQDRADELQFETQQTVVTLPAYSVGVLQYRTRLKPSARRLIGRTKTHTITAAIAPQKQNQGGPQLISGQVISRAWVPAWAPLLMGILGVGVFLLLSLFFAPNFTDRRVLANGVEVALPIAGEGTRLEWQSINACSYSVLRNDVLYVRRERTRPINAVIIPNIAAGETIELQLRGCTLIRRKNWILEAVAAPSPEPAPPQLSNFSLRTQNVKTSGGGVGGPVHESAAENQQILLVGQTGNLCVEWTFAEPFDPKAFSVSFISDPQIDAIEQSGPILEMSGSRCFPIAETFQDANADYKQAWPYYIRMRMTNLLTGAETIPSETKVIQVFRPVCTVNTSGPLLVREGPGRAFPARGELLQGTAVFPVSGPVLPNEQAEKLYWTQIMLQDDPRPVWVAYSYLDCQVPINSLPLAEDIPATPTPLPTPTPTATPLPPTPLPEPIFSIDPSIINQNGCAIVKWAVQNVREVYLNNEGVVGESERQVCHQIPGQYVYNWRIVGQDGSIIEKSLTLLVNGPAGDPPPTE